MRLIDSDELEKRFIQECDGECGLCKYETFDNGVYSCKLIKDSPTVELDESIIQEVLNKRCMTAVANEYLVALHGKRPQGDLISREALKEDFKRRLALCNEWIEKAKDKETKIRASAVKTFIVDILITIDNAPTVPLSDFKEGYKQAIRDGKTNFSRPQGKWVKSKDGYTRCDQCGRRGSAIKANFCHHCGADMREEASE